MNIQSGSSFLLALGLAATLSLGTVPAQAQISFATSQSFSTVNNDRAVELVVTGDLDQDGDLDMVLISSAFDRYYNSYLITLLNDGNGKFTSANQTHPLNNFANDLVLGDFDGDGDLDLITTYNASYGVATLTLLKNRGDGTFGPQRLLAPLRDGAFFHSIAAGDLDSDGDLDLVAGASISLYNLQEGQVGVVLNQNNTVFSSGARGKRPQYPADLAVGDLDGDGDLDVVVANTLTDDVTILLNQGDATFKPAGNFEAGNGPRAVALGDLDSDQDLDVVVINRFGQDLGVLKNLGAANFAPPQLTALGNHPETLLLGDFDHDLDLDVVVASPREDFVKVLTNQGDGSFAPSISVSAGVGPIGLASGDLNQDSKLDLIVSSFGVRLSNLQVLFNTTP